MKWISEAIIRGKNPISGAQVIQITSAPIISNNIYCEQPYCTPDGERFAFIRIFYHPHEIVKALWICDLKTRRIAMVEPEIQLGVANCKYSGIIYYGVDKNDGRKLIKLSLDTLEKEVVFNLDGVPIKRIYSVSPDQRYCLGFNIPRPGKCQVIRLDLKRGDWKIIHENVDIINPHLQYEPSRGNDILVQHNRGGMVDEAGNIIRLVGEEGATHYVIDNEGKNYRQLPVGKPYTAPSTGHSCWVGDTGEILVTVRASHEEALRNGNLLMAKPGAKRAKTIAKGYRFGHISASKDGKYFIGDAWNAPGKPIVVGSIKTGRCMILCNPETSGGSPQYTHPHPYMTGDNKWIIYNSDKTGIPQIYVARIPPEFLDSLTA